ncbi:MAG: DUF805 domain-containing protein [Alistipes sp.]|nr:DUF805 domain-containing protein [Alistipes sp.]MBR5893097.1 DUF805 domain-containing protein [Bacteroidaceae bacterium]
MKTMGFIEALESVVVKNYANFSGRARRSEYWYFALANFIFGAVTGLMSVEIPEVMYLVWIVGVALLIPSLAVCVRRLHDIGKSGWWYLIGLVPYIGAIVLIVFFVKDSQPGENKWGANPKE